MLGAEWMADKNYKLKYLELMKTQIHELRTRIDGLAQLVKSLDGYSLMVVDVNKKVSDWPILDCSSYLKDCYKSLLLSKAWLGKVLAELGEETPYKNDGNRKTVEDIEPTADASGGQGLFKDDFELLWWKNELNYIEKIDWLREEINNTTTLVYYQRNANVQYGDYLKPYNIDFSIQHLNESRFYLGFELQRIKEQSK